MGMRWPDEHWVKLYTRDTPTWRGMAWQARAVLPLLLRKMDKAGLLECGQLGRSGVALMVDLPEEVVAPGLASLERFGVVAWHGDTLEVPKFEEAQESKSSDLVRKREERQRAKDRARAGSAAEATAQPAAVPQGVSRAVTHGHAASRGVTPRPDQTAQTRQHRGGEAASPPPPVEERRAPDSPLRQKPAPTPPPEPPSDGLNLRDKLEAVYLAKRRAKYRWRTADDIASREVLAAAEGDWGVVLDVWGRALERTKFPVCGGMADLSRHWNAYAGEEPTEKRSAALSIGQGTAPPLEAIPEPPPILPCEVCAGWGGKELEGHALCVPHMREATRSELVFPEDRRPAGEELGVWIVRKRPGPAEVAA